MKKDLKLGLLTFKKLDVIILFLILFIALALRLYKINAPLADLHSWRQADTAAVTRNFVRNGFDLLHPNYDDLSNIQSGIENPQGYRFVEFPIYNAIVGFIYKTAPLFSLEIYGRLITALFSLIIIGVIYYLALKESGRITAIIASLTYAILPFFVFFSRVVLPDMTAISLMMISILLIYLNIYEKNRNRRILLFFLSVIFFSSSLLVKPTTIFYSLVPIYLFYRKYGYMFLTKIWTYVYFVLGLIPLIWWRYYILSYPEGIPVSNWLITSVNTYQGLQNIFFRPAFFRWVFFERINNLILGGFTTVFLILGILKRQKNYFFYSFLISSLLYLFTFQGGNVQHEYYQINILPTLALFVGLGAAFILENNKIFVYPLVSGIIVIGLFASSFYFSYFKVQDYYSYPHDLPQIAQIINTLTEKNDKIVTDTLGDTTLLYLADRKGSPAVYKGLAELKKIGYSYFYTAKEDVIKQIKIETSFKVVFENNKFALFKL